jgi:hypothetical protein
METDRKGGNFMKRFTVGILLIAAMGAAIGALFAEVAQARGYSCYYRGYGVYVALSGSDNNPYGCREFNSQFHGRRVNWAYGRTYCVFVMEEANVTVAVKSTDSWTGRRFCRTLTGMLPSGWYRGI